MDQEITTDDFASLADKLAGMELTPAEKILLNAIIENAEDEADVTGFAMTKDGGLGYDSAAHLLNQNITKGRVQVASRWVVDGFDNTRY